MSIPKEAYQALQSIVGPEWVSDDPAICNADMKGGAGTGIRDIDSVRPVCSIQPRTTEEVQGIVKIANRYGLLYSPTSTFFNADTAPHLKNTILLDLKRMEDFEIHEKDMYVVSQPGVAFSMVQWELFKKGLFTFVPGSGSQCSVVANHIFCGDAPMGWRYGLGYRRILACEWVLPDGEILKLGTKSMIDDYFWGEGPGPDLRGLLRGTKGHSGGLGVVTKLAFKVFPFVPEMPWPVGLGPHATYQLPESRFKIYNCRFPSIKQLADAVYELGKCEIGLVVMHVDPVFGYVARARGRGANVFWEEFTKAKETLDVNQGWLRVVLCGFTSEKQLAYEEKVLVEVVTAHGATAKPARPFDETNLQSADAISANFVGRRFASILYFESLDHCVKVGKENAERKKKYVPPLPDTYGLPGWYVPYDFAHICKEENLNQSDVDDVVTLGELANECRQNDLKMGAYPWAEDPNMFGPAFFGYDRKLKEIKEIFDPCNVSNPPAPIGHGHFTPTKPTE